MEAVAEHEMLEFSPSEIAQAVGRDAQCQQGQAARIYIYQMIPPL